MATKNLVPRADLEGQLGIVTPVLRRWKEINAGAGQLDLLKTNELQNTLGNPLFVSADNSVTITRTDTGSGFQYDFASQGGGSITSDKIFEGTSSLQNMVETIRTNTESKIKFTIGGTPNTGWEIDNVGHMLPYDNNKNNIGNSSRRVKEVFLMPDALTFADGKINVSSSKRLQFGIPNGSSHIYDDISLTKSSVKVATTSANEFAGFNYDNGSSTLTAPSAGIISSVDTKSLSVNDRILVKSRTNKEENGIYVVTNAGSTADSVVLTRATDLNKDENFIGTSVSVLEGTNNGQKLFFVTPPASGGSTVGTHSQNWITFGDSLNTSGVQTVIENMFDSTNQFLFDSSTGKFQTKLSLNDLTDVNVGTPDLDDNNKVLKWDNTANKFVLGTDNSSMTSADIGAAVGDMVSNNTETGIEVTYQSSDNTLDFVVNLSNVSSTTLSDGANLVRTTGDATFGAFTYNFTGSTITVASPTANDHAVNKQYVDNLVSGLKTKSSVRLATTSAANLNGFTYDSAAATLTSSANSLTIDSKTVVNGDRILVKDQSTKTQNGIYVVSGVGSAVVLTRTSDLTTSDNAASAYAFVGEGTLNGDKGFVCTSTSPNDVVGTHDIEFTAFSSSSQVIAGGGLSKSGQTLSVNVDGTSIKINSGDQLEVGEISADAITSGFIDINRLPQSIQNLTTNQFDNNDINPSSLSTAFTDPDLPIHEMDTFIVRDVSENVTRKAAAGRILEYVRKSFTGEVQFNGGFDSNNLKIIDTVLDKTAIQSRTLKDNLVSEDLFLIADSADTNKLKKVKLSAIQSAALDIVGLDSVNENDAQLTDDDVLAIHEITSGTNRKVTISQIKGATSSKLQYKPVKLTSNSNLSITGVANTHYHIQQVSTYTGQFIFDFNNTPGEDGDIIKISMTNFNAQYIDPSEDISDIWSASDNIVKIKTLGLTNENILQTSNASNMAMVYNCRDFDKPVEFICEKINSTTFNWWPSIDKSHTLHQVFSPSNMTVASINAHISANYLDFWTRFTTAFIALDDATQAYQLPSANTVASSYGAKPGDTWTWFFTSSSAKTVKFSSGADDIATRGTNPKSPNYENNITINFGTNNTLKKITLTLSRLMRSSTPAGTWYHDYFWVIEHFVDVAEAIDISQAQDGQIVGVKVNSPAEFEVDFIKDKNIGVGQIKGLNTSTNTLDSTSTSKIALETITGGTDNANDRGNIALNTISTENLKKINNKKVLGSLLNTGAEAGANNPVTEVNVIDNLADFTPSNISSHTNLVTATAVKEFFLQSQASGFPNARAVYASQNTASEIMTVGNVGRTTPADTGSNDIVGTIALTLDDVETGVTVKAHSTSGFLQANVNSFQPGYISIAPANVNERMKVAIKADLTPTTVSFVKQRMNYLFGNVSNSNYKWNAGTLTDGAEFVYRPFRNCYRVQLPEAETFWNKYGPTEQLIYTQKSLGTTMGDSGIKGQGVVFVTHPQSANNHLFGTQTILDDMPTAFNRTVPFVFIDNSSGRFVTTDEANFRQEMWQNNSSAGSNILRSNRSFAIRLTKVNYIPLVTYKAGASNLEVLGNVPNAFVWSITRISPAYDM